MSGMISDFETRLEQLIDEWMAHGGEMGDVEDEHGQNRSVESGDEP